MTTPSLGFIENGNFVGNIEAKQLSCKNLYSPSLGGDTSITGDLEVSGTLSVTSTTNQLILGTTNTTTINSVAPSADRVYTIPDAGGAASFVMTLGTQTVGGNKTFTGSTILDSALSITPTTNQIVLGTTNTTTINSTAPSASRVYTIPDAGGAASFVMTAGTQTIAGNKTLSGTTTLATTNITSGGLTLPTSGGTPSTNDFYEATSFTMTFGVAGSGVGATTTDVTVQAVRNGTQVTLIVPAFTVVVGASGGVSLTAATLPARFCPTTNTSQAVRVQTAAGTNALSYLIVTNGTIVIFSTPTNTAWSAGATVGIPHNITVSYIYNI